MATTYYRDHSIHVSSAGVRVGDEWYALDELTYVWHQRTGRLRHGGYMLLTRGGAVAVLIGLLVAAGFAARSVDFTAQDSLYVAGGILGIVVIGGIAAFSVEGLLDLVDRAHDHGKGQHEIWARDRADVEFMLYATTDAPRFGQIYRALQRALDHDTVAH